MEIQLCINKQSPQHSKQSTFCAGINELLTVFFDSVVEPLPRAGVDVEVEAGVKEEARPFAASCFKVQSGTR